MLEAQRRNRGWTRRHRHERQLLGDRRRRSPLAPIHERFGIKRSLRGDDAGDLGRRLSRASPSLDILGNVIPFIGDEEAKIESEMQKFLGTVGRRRDRVGADHGERALQSRSRRDTATPSACPCDLRRTRERRATSTRAFATGGAPSDARGLPTSPERPLDRRATRRSAAAAARRRRAATA